MRVLAQALTWTPGIVHRFEVERQKTWTDLDKLYLVWMKRGRHFCCAGCKWNRWTSIWGIAIFVEQFRTHLLLIAMRNSSWGDPCGLISGSRSEISMKLKAWLVKNLGCCFWVNSACRLETARTLRQQASRMSEDALACAQRLCNLKLFNGSHCAMTSTTWMWFIHLGQLKLCWRIAQWQQDKWQTFAFQKHSKQRCIGGFFRLQTWSPEPTWSDTKSFRRTCEVFDSQFRIGFNMIYIKLYWLMLKIDLMFKIQNNRFFHVSCQCRPPWIQRHRTIERILIRRGRGISSVTRWIFTSWCHEFSR